jgi:probable HAF family extracellular repeat protein
MNPFIGWHRRMAARGIAAVVLAMAATGVFAQNYKFTLLGALDRGNYSDGLAINSGGQIVGRARGRDLDDHRAVIWKGKQAQDLPLLGWPYAINDHGMIVGVSDVVTTFHAMVWHRGTAMDLGTLGGTSSSAEGVNRHGQVVGSSDLEGDVMHRGFLWADGVMTELPSGGRSSNAGDINASGQIVGQSQTASGQMHAALWPSGTSSPIDLGTIGGREGRNSSAQAINDAGVVVGVGDADGGAHHAILWKDGLVIDLGTLGGRHSFAYDINNQGQIVGYSDSSLDKHNHHKATIWNGTTPMDLNRLLPHDARDAGWELIVARGINDDGVITGQARNKFTREDRAFRLAPKAAE